MLSVLTNITEAVRHLMQALFPSDLAVMSDEVKEILSNPDDAQKYQEAVREINTGEKKEVTIELSGQRRLTLTQ